VQRCFRLCCLYDTLLILHKYLHVFYISRISPETRVTFVCPSKCTSYIYLLYKSVNSFYLLCKCQCLPITRSSPCQIREQLGCIQIFQRCVRFPSRWSSIQHSWNVFMCARKHIFLHEKYVTIYEYVRLQKVITKMVTRPTWRSFRRLTVTSSRIPVSEQCNQH